MKKIKNGWISSGVLAVLMGLSFLPADSGAQDGVPDAFDPQDFSGDWDRDTRIVTFSNVPGSSRAPNNQQIDDVGPVVEAAFTRAGKSVYDTNLPGYGPRARMERNDPLGRCEPMGIPRNLAAEILVPHNTLEIVQLPDRIIQFFEYRHDWREIWMDGRELPDLEVYDPKWNGYSVGHLEGDTLVVESIGFDERSWLDKYGYPHSEEMHLVERYRRLDADTLELTMTLTDPVIYSKPWESDVKLYKLNREKHADWEEQIYCVPAEEMMFQDLMGTGNVIE
jgi:hypothetical protein